MPLYFLLGTLTQEGQQLLCNNADMAVDAIRDCDVDGAEILGQYAVLGRYDFVMFAEADDNDAIARLSLDLGLRMGLHVETLPALAIGVLTEGGPGDRLQHSESSPAEWGIPDNES